MKIVRVWPCGLPQELQAGFAEMAAHEGFVCAENGIRITAHRALQFSARCQDRCLTVGYQNIVQFFRALSYLKENGSAPFSVVRQPVFSENGVMLDCSRNAVLAPHSVCLLLRKMALMGLNTAMLYTEDTYEIPGQPYFGYLRGAYTAQELRALDAYAACLGIELIPCIQTLAHLERALHWPQNDPALRDTEDILMVGEEKAYALIEQMIRAVSGAFRTKRIHIGMDEAWSLGLGNYRFKNGFVPSARLMKEHLAQVWAITQKYGLQPMMWSDMYLRAASPTGEYYHVPDRLPQEVLNAADPGVALVYWDYYHQDPAVYRRLLEVHAQFACPTIFAGGLWTWAGPAPALDKMRSSSLPALQECQARGVRSVFATAWGDNGGEANLLTALYGMQFYAEYAYTGCTDEPVLAARFNACTGEIADAFFQLSAFNNPPGVLPKTEDPVNAAKFLLYEDPLLPLFTADTAGMDFVRHYRNLETLYASFSSQDSAFEALYRFYEQLARLLALKSAWRSQAPLAQKASAAAAGLALLAQQCARQCSDCKLAWELAWEKTNKPFGFEIIDLRLSGLKGRFETAARQMQRLAAGEIERIETLACPKLRYLTNQEGRFSGCYSWGECISACRI